MTDARERAWLEQCRSLDTRHITALTEEMFRAGYDAARAECERKVAETRDVLQKACTANHDRAEKAEARVRELEEHLRVQTAALADDLATAQARIAELEDELQECQWSAMGEDL